MKENKIIFTGPVGVGKTTAIAALSDDPPVKTDARASDMTLVRKGHTTVAMDYGVIRLLDNTRANPLKDLTFFLYAFKDLLKTAPLVVGVTKMDVRSLPGIDVYQKYLAQHNFNVPVFEVDARQEEDVKQLVSAMLFSIDPGLEA